MSVCTTDINNDGNKDIITSHYFDNRFDWGGLNIMENVDNEYFANYMKVKDTLLGKFLLSDTIINKQIPDIICFGIDHAKIYSIIDNDVNITEVYIGDRVNYGDLGDIDNNGFLDLIFASNNNQYWGIVYNYGDGTFSQPFYYDLDTYPVAIQCKDMNNDGLDDVILVNSEIEVHINKGDYFDVIKIPSVASKLDAVDFNNDGLIDIVSYLGLTNHVKLFQNMGNSTYELINEFWLSTLSAGFVSSDLNGDDLVDLLFYTSPFGSETGFFLYYNTSNFNFDETKFIELKTQGEEYRYAISDDVDNNGYNDIIASCWLRDTTYSDASRLVILYNDGNGNFVETPPISINENYSTLNFFDIYPNPISNNATIEIKLSMSSKVKLYIINLQGSQESLILNETIEKGNHFICFDPSNPKFKLIKGIYVAVLEINGQKNASKILYII